jgi:hypothetical protein
LARVKENMTDLIQRITEAIFRQEGMPSDYKNPGNLRGAPWLANPVIENGFWVPMTRMQGIAGAAHVVALHIAEGQSLRQFIAGYAPSSDNNNTEAYIKNVSEWAAIPNVDTPLWAYIDIQYLPS